MAEIGGSQSDLHRDEDNGISHIAHPLEPRGEFEQTPAEHASYGDTNQSSSEFAHVALDPVSARVTPGSAVGDCSHMSTEVCDLWPSRHEAYR